MRRSHAPLTGLLAACLLTSTMGCARQPVPQTTVVTLKPPASLLAEIPPPALAGDTNADLARAYLECVGVVREHNEDKAAIRAWQASPPSPLPSAAR